MKKNIAETVRGIITEPLIAAGFTVWNVRYEKEGPDYILLIEVDKPGISIDDISAANDIAEPLIDAADPIEGGYCLEVSSAGLTRDLLKKEHFEYAAAKGAETEIRTFTPVNGQKQFTGKLEAVGDTEVTICGTSIDRKSIAKATATFE